MQEAFQFYYQGEKILPQYSYTWSDLCQYLLDNNEPVLGFDIETEGLDPFDSKRRILSIAFAWKEQGEYRAACKLWRELDLQDESILRAILENKNNLLVGHNIKFDLNWMRQKFGFNPKVKLFDTLLASYLVDENVEQNSLDVLLSIYLPDMFDAEQYAKDKSMRSKMNMQSIEHQINYNCKDAEASLRLAEVLWQKLSTSKRRRLALMGSHTLNVLSRIEVAGAYIDFDFAGQREKELVREMIMLRNRIVETTGVALDISSPQQLIPFLKQLGYTLTEVTDKGQLSTTSDTLRELKRTHSNNLNNSILDDIIAFRKASKLYKTYYVALRNQADVNNRVHTSYFLGKNRSEDGTDAGTVTGRLSSSGPNLQNSPRDKKFRGMFAAPSGYGMVDGDFSQLELRAVAYLSRDKKMIEAFKEKRDIHTSAMSALLNMPYDILVQRLNDPKDPEATWLKEMRVAIKRINFGIVYGVREHRLQKLLKNEMGLLWPIEKCKELISDWLDTYTGVADYIQRQQKTSLQYGCVEMPMGQRRHFKGHLDPRSPEGRRAMRQASNFPVQSLASWMCLLGMNALDEYLSRLSVPAQIMLQVHDSITSIVGTAEILHLTKVQNDVIMIMEVGTRKLLRDIFNISFDIPLEFPTTICERWG